jgi:hypothetical protein
MAALDAKQLIEAIPADGKILEVAGPTHDGTVFLSRVDARLPARPLVTNLTNPAVFQGLPPYPLILPVDAIVDVRRLPRNNYDLIICSYLTWFDESRPSLDWLYSRLAQVAYAVRYSWSRSNLHISLFREASKSLKPGGLLLIEGLTARDYSFAQHFGFICVYRYDEDAEVSSALFQKSKG